MSGLLYDPPDHGTPDDDRLPGDGYILLDTITRLTGTEDRFPLSPPGTRAVQIHTGEVTNYFLATFGRAPRETPCSCEVNREANLSQALHKDFEQQLKYYNTLPERSQEAMRSEIQGTQQLLQMLTMMETQYKTGSVINGLNEHPGIITSGDSGKKDSGK